MLVLGLIVGDFAFGSVSGLLLLLDLPPQLFLELGLKGLVDLGAQILDFDGTGLLVAGRMDFLLLVSGQQRERVERTRQHRLIPGRDFPRRPAVDHVRLVPVAQQQRAQQDRKVEAIARLPAQRVGRGWNHRREHVGWVQFLVLHVVRQEFAAGFPVVQLLEGQLGRTKGGANELELSELVLWSQEQGPVGTVGGAELRLPGEDVLEDQLLLGRVLFERDWNARRLG